MQCKNCGACKSVEAETRGGQNQGRMYNKCVECGKWLSWVGEAPPAPKPKWNAPRAAFNAVGNAFRSRAPFQEPTPQEPIEEPRTPVSKRPREEDTQAYRTDQEEAQAAQAPPPKRQRPEDQIGTIMLDMLAGFGTVVKKFEQASAKLDLLAEKLVTCGRFKETKETKEEASGQDDVNPAC